MKPAGWQLPGINSEPKFESLISTQDFKPRRWTVFYQQKLNERSNNWRNCNCILWDGCQGRVRKFVTEQGKKVCY